MPRPRPYYTLCIWDAEFGAWFDTFGSYSLSEVKTERDSEKDNGTKAKFLAIIKTDDSAAAMIAARDSLPRP